MIGFWAKKNLWRAYQRQRSADVPDSFIPLALVRNREKPEPLEPDPPFPIPLEWMTIMDRNPGQWTLAEEIQKEVAANLGVSLESIRHPMFKPKERKAPTQKAEIFYYHTDHLGTPQELTAAEGQIVWST